MKKNVFPSFWTLLSGLFLLTIPVKAQTSYYFYVQLKDKNNSPYSLSNPSAYLSQRAIDRRTTFGVAIDSTDLPVNPSYVQQIENLGVHVHCASKWMNGVTVKVTDSTKMSQVRALSFVRFVEYTGLLQGAALTPVQKTKQQNLTYDYGLADTQISQLNGKGLHEQGFMGQGIEIGVIDAGFTNVDTNAAFDSLRLQGRLLGTKDIINPNSNIYSEDDHGAYVLSIMAGNLPGQYLGTAPKASYWLIRTEYSPTEYKVETDFWCSGIEFADSVGVDEVTSSLGYYTFDDPTMSFTYADMNGKVSRASRAATIGAQKGIVVLVAAGNEGESAWHYIGSPADADGIIAVGGVDATGAPSSFTSYGPSADGRVKPEVAAMGTSTAIVSISGTPITGNGTSFATPTMAGMTACLLQFCRLNNSRIYLPTFLNGIFRSASLFPSHDDRLGYGIPDFLKAMSYMPALDAINDIKDQPFTVSYDETSHTVFLKLYGSTPANATVALYSVVGQKILSQPLNSVSTVLNTNGIPAGVYVLQVNSAGRLSSTKILIK